MFSDFTTAASLLPSRASEYSGQILVVFCSGLAHYYGDSPCPFVYLTVLRCLLPHCTLDFDQRPLSGD